jgi:hypothetical protein
MKARRVGERYSDTHNAYDEGTQYCYHDGMHDLVLFWHSPSAVEVAAFSANAVEFGVLVDFPALFLLYHIEGACEWSDVAYSVHLLKFEEQVLPPDNAAPAPLRITLVDAGDGMVLGVREVALGPGLAQLVARVMEAQAAHPWSKFEYDAAVQAAYARYPDTEAMLEHALAIEPAWLP